MLDRARRARFDDGVGGQVLSTSEGSTTPSARCRRRAPRSRGRRSNARRDRWRLPRHDPWPHDIAAIDYRAERVRVQLEDDAQVGALSSTAVHVEGVRLARQ